MGQPRRECRDQGFGIHPAHGAPELSQMKCHWSTVCRFSAGPPLRQVHGAIQNSDGVFSGVLEVAAEVLEDPGLFRLGGNFLAIAQD